MTSFNERIDDIIDEHIKREIKIDEVFTGKYIPANLPHRKEETSKIADLILKKTNIMITGLISSGKTVSLIKVFERLRVRFPENYYIYINCRDMNRPQIFYKILTELGVDAKSSGWAIGKYITKYINAIKEKKQIVICLDEVEDLKKRYDPQMLFYTLADEDKIVRIIFISNNSDFYNSLNPKVRSRLDMFEIPFIDYSESQLYDILIERIKNGLEKTIIFNDEIRVISSLAFKDMSLGRARMAIKVLSDVIDYKLDHPEIEDKKLNKEKIRFFFIKIKDKAEILALEQLPDSHKIVLKIICILKSKKRETDIYGIKDYWDRIADEYKYKKVVNESIRLYLDDLITHGYIETEKKHSKLRGRKILIYNTKFSSDVFLNICGMHEKNYINFKI